MPRLSKVFTRALVPLFMPRLAALSLLDLVVIAFATFGLAESLALSKLLLGPVLANELLPG